MALFKLLPRTLKGRQSCSFISINRFSFSSPEDAAAERRRRRRLLGMPLLSALGDIPRPSAPDQPPVRKPQASPSIPKLPEAASSLSGPRLLLHNNILSLLRSGDIQEAILLVRHSVYSNCRPTIYTVNAVLSALLNESLHSELLSLHRFVIQAGIVPSVVTHNLLIQSYIDSCKLDLAISYYRFLCRDLPLLPSPSTYRILVKALLSASKMQEALQLKDEMNTLMEPDIEVYNLLMSELVDSGDPDGALALYEELTGKLGENLKSFGGIVHGSLMKAYFKKGMQKEALELYDSVLGKEGSQLRFTAQSYNSILDAFFKNGKFEESFSLFERMMAEHCPPRRLSVNLESFTLMVDGYCATGMFKEAIDLFRKINEKKITADVLAYNNLIGKVGQNGMVVVAEELYREMREHDVKPNEHTFALLMEACFVAQRIEDAIQFFSEMANSGVEPGTLAYNTVLCGLVKAGNPAEAKAFFDRMMEKEVKRDLLSYEVLLKAFCDSNRLDDLFVVVRALLMDKNVVFKPQMKELVEDAARGEQMEGELARLYDEVEKEKKDALVRAAEEKLRADALSKEERLRKRAEAKAKQAATTKITKEHIEMHIKRFSLNNIEEKEDVPHFGGIFGNGGGPPKQVSDCIGSSEVFKVRNADNSA
ncbi:pentatricopeptide repeat-containing protein At3g49240-like [Phalaenopsis equestris]|uniref:pentatricopeptide repeat-containing protein At3g49240-like n=1 Tax=Phalaenopsis equestris TaxID=78828 RepID=UPI0009E254BC|nr:pentatricopeptide repeat-containing protein At3g49240-like [Phalaenopsis equestris]